MHAVTQARPAMGAQPRTKGETYEGLAFTFCKAATIVLLTQKFALPVASGAAALFFVLAHRHGKKDTRCIVRVPLLIAGFWSIVALLSMYTIVRPLLGR